MKLSLLIVASMSLLVSTAPTMQGFSRGVNTVNIRAQGEGVAKSSSKVMKRADDAADTAFEPDFGLKIRDDAASDTAFEPDFGLRVRDDAAADTAFEPDFGLKVRDDAATDTAFEPDFGL